MSGNLYQDLCQAVKLLHNDKSGQFCQTKANEIWSKFKKETTNPVDLHNLVDAKIKKIKEEASRKKFKVTSFFLQVS